MWFDNLAWYENLLGNTLFFYLIFYAGYWAGKNNILKFVSKDYGEEFPK